MIGSGLLITPPRNRIENGGGSIVVNADGSISLTPASGKVTRVDQPLVVQRPGTTLNPGLFVLNPSLGQLVVNDAVEFANGPLYIGNEGIVELRASIAQIRFGDPVDLAVIRDAANTLAQRNGANGQTFRLYNTYTDTSNYERLGIGWATNVLTIAPEAAGTGALRGMVLGPVSGSLAFYGGTPQTKPAVTGSRGGNAALASLLTALASLGLLTDSTTA